MEALDKELIELTARKKLFPKEYGGDLEDIDSTPGLGFWKGRFCGFNNNQHVPGNFN